MVFVNEMDLIVEEIEADVKIKPTSSFSETSESKSMVRNDTATTTTTRARQRSTLVSSFLDAQRQKCLNTTFQSTLNTKLPPLSAGICQRLQADGRTVASLWQDHLSQLVDAAMHPDDPQQVHRRWIDQLLRVVPPRLLERSLLASLGAADMKRIVDIIDRRLLNPSSSSAPPLLVAVFGGSVAEGTGCNKIPSELGELSSPSSIRGKQCSWPLRLQFLVDAFLGPGIIQIENLAVGGTNSYLALPTLEYRLYPLSSPQLLAHGPDIIINGYSVNDNLPDQSVASNSTSSRTHWGMGLGKAQHFIAMALKSRPCQPPPSLVYLDEYFGNQNELLLGEDIRNNAVRFSADHYTGSVGYVSSSLPVKPFCYANEPETFFSPNWWRNRMAKVRLTDGHFGMPGHQLAAYSLAYAALRAVSDYCVGVHDTVEKAATLGDQTPPAPMINDKLTFAAKYDKNYREQWKQHEEAYCSSADVHASPCPLAFVATPAGTARNAGELNNYLKPFIVQNSGGWSGENNMRNGWQNKLGLVTHRPGAVLHLRLPNVANRVRIITLHYLRSYGETWANSTARFDVTIRNSTAANALVKHEHSFQAQGFHDMTFSIAYPMTVDLKENAAQIGDTVDLKITLIGGSEFKIISLLMCSR